MNHLIVPRNWNRFEIYAVRVKKWLPEDLSYIEESVVDHIAFGRNPGYILPRLNHLEVTATNVSSVHLQTLILCPTLRSVAVWNAEPTTWATRAMNAFFRTLADRAPVLRKLTVHWGDGTVVTPAFVEGLADVFSNEESALESVNLWSPLCISSKSFGLLSKMHNLTTLHLNLIAIDDVIHLCSEVIDRMSAFPVLQNLFLAGSIDQFPKIIRFLQSAADMISLRFSVREYPRSAQLLNVLKTVSATFPRLQILQINVPKEELLTSHANRHYTANPDFYYHNLNILRPFLSMRRLQAVHLDLGVPIYLTDEDLSAIGSAWPDIKVLSLCSDPYCDYTRSARPTSTIFGLLALAQACPSLQHLGLFVDGSVGLSEQFLASTIPASRALRHLNVGRSWIVEPPLMAGLLSGAFPALRVLEWTGMDSLNDSWANESISNHATAWRQVFELLPIFRSVALTSGVRWRPRWT